MLDPLTIRSFIEIGGMAIIALFGVKFGAKMIERFQKAQEVSQEAMLEVSRESTRAMTLMASAVEKNTTAIRDLTHALGEHDHTPRKAQR